MRRRMDSGAAQEEQHIETELCARRRLHAALPCLLLDQHDSCDPVELRPVSRLLACTAGDESGAIGRAETGKWPAGQRKRGTAIRNANGYMQVGQALQRTAVAVGFSRACCHGGASPAGNAARAALNTLHCRCTGCARRDSSGGVQTSPVDLQQMAGPAQPVNPS